LSRPRTRTPMAKMARLTEHRVRRHPEIQQDCRSNHWAEPEMAAR
jgi:hypothetical protein